MSMPTSISRHEPGTGEWETMLGGKHGFWYRYFSDNWTIVQTSIHSPEHPAYAETANHNDIALCCKADRAGFDKFVGSFIENCRTVLSDPETDWDRKSDEAEGASQLLASYAKLPAADQDKAEYIYEWAGAG